MADCLSSKVLRRISKEVNALRTDPSEGIRIVVNEDDITDLKAWIQGPAETPYENGYFKISIRFGPEYPSLPPNCTFATKIFHPNVGPKGEICVNTLKKDWTSTQTLTEILTVVKCLLIYPNPESALDEEAGRLLLERYEEYRLRAKLWTDIHARTRPVEFDPVAADQPDSSPPAAQAARRAHEPLAVCSAGSQSPSELTVEPRPTMQPFASSNQANNPSRLTAAPQCEHVTKAGSIVAVEGENRNPPITMKTNNATKDKDRRGRKRL